MHQQDDKRRTQLGESRTIRVLMIGDSRLASERLRECLDRHGQSAVVEHRPFDEPILHILDTATVDVLILDADAETLELASTVDQVRTTFPRLPILVIGRIDRVNARTLYQQGVTLRLPKTATCEQLVGAIQDAVVDAHAPRLTQTHLSILTRRELQVFRLLQEGCRNIDIAGELDVSVATVEYHVSNILTKLGVRSRWEIIEARRRLGMQHPEQFPR